MGGNSSSQRPLVIGRSQSSDMILDYRTVSTHHAAINFSAGSFSILDLRSSNGSFLYVKEPLMLRWGETVRLRWGKGSISLKAHTTNRSCLPIGICNSTNAVNIQEPTDPDMIHDLLTQLASTLPIAHLPHNGVPVTEPRFRGMFCYEERKSDREEEKSRIQNEAQNNFENLSKSKEDVDQCIDEFCKDNQEKCQIDVLRSSDDE
jgi:hypothetical protein